MKSHSALAAWVAAGVIAWPAVYAAPGATGRIQGEGTQKAQPAKEGEGTRVSNGEPHELKPAPGGGHGKVWVNTQARVYHCEGDPLYGRTRKGAYMTEARARAKGAQPLMDRSCS